MPAARSAGVQCLQENVPCLILEPSAAENRTGVSSLVGIARRASATFPRSGTRLRCRSDFMHGLRTPCVNTRSMLNPGEPLSVARTLIENELRTAYSNGVRHFFYEQEPPFTRPILESARMSAEYLSKLTL